MESDPEKKLEIIQAMPKMWTAEQIMFMAGALFTALAIFFLTIRMKTTSPFNLGVIASLIILIAAILWSWHAFERILSPEGFLQGNSTPHLFIIYSVLTQIGLALLGFAFLSTDFAKWIGWMFIAGGLLLFILMMATGDMPPFTYYILTLIFSISLFFKAGVN